MKSIIGFIFLIVIALSTGCGSSNPIVGKWKPAQRYDASQGIWEPAKDEVFLEFFSDGTFGGFVRGERAGGNYTVDTSATPNHLVLDKRKSTVTNAVFKVEGNTLTMKSYLESEAIFPAKLEPVENEPNFELVKYERQQ